MAIAKIVNLTGRTVCVTVPLDVMEEKTLEFEPNGTTAKATIRFEVAAKIATDQGEIPIMRVSKAKLSNLPDPQPGVMYIVTEHVVQAAIIAGRPVEDLLAYPNAFSDQTERHDYLSDKLCFPQ